jgi:transposase
VRALLVTAPVELREQLRDLSATMLVRAATTPTPSPAGWSQRRGHAPRLAAWHAAAWPWTPRSPPWTPTWTGWVTRAAPRLLELFGVGVETAGALLVAAGDHPGRLGGEAAFAKRCGVAPLEASSGKTIRHRLDRGGDRRAKAALYRIVLVRLRWHQPTRDYVTRRISEGKSKREIIRCLKQSNTPPPAIPLVNGPVVRLPAQHGKVRRDGYRAERP